MGKTKPGNQITAGRKKEKLTWNRVNKIPSINFFVVFSPLLTSPQKHIYLNSMDETLPPGKEISYYHRLSLHFLPIRAVQR